MLREAAVAEVEAEAMRERILDLHDQLGHAILASAAAATRRHAAFFHRRARASYGSPTAMVDARSLRAIRAALEDLEGHLRFLHAVRSQQQSERDAAIVRLEQSRIVLTTRLAKHQGKNHKVIEEALAFVGEMHNKSRFVPSEDVYRTRCRLGENTNGHRSNMLVRMLSCSLALAKNSIKLERIGGVLSNAAVFAVSMLTFLQLHQVAFRSKTPAIQYRKRIDNHFQAESSRKNGKEKHLEVLSARG